MVAGIVMASELIRYGMSPALAPNVLWNSTVL